MSNNQLIAFIMLIFYGLIVRISPTLDVNNPIWWVCTVISSLLTYQICFKLVK